MTGNDVFLYDKSQHIQHKKNMLTFIIQLRISELCGLTLDDVDMGIINVNHQVLYDSEIWYYIPEPKTKKGDRQIPMSENVYNAFLSILETTTLSKYEIEYKSKIFTNFIFCKATGAATALFSKAYGQNSKYIPMRSFFLI